VLQTQPLPDISSISATQRSATAIWVRRYACHMLPRHVHPERAAAMGGSPLLTQTTNSMPPAHNSKKTNMNIQVCCVMVASGL
jgi:hypothetical protein